MFKNAKLVGAIIAPFKKLTSKQKASLKQTRLKNRFALLLHRKRLLKFFYGKVGEITMLEKQIDVALFRLNFCPSIRNARQAILHKRVFLNNRLLNSPSYTLKPGDVISLKWDSQPTAQNNATGHNKLSRKNPSFEINYASLTAVYLYPAEFTATPFQWQ